MKLTFLFGVAVAAIALAACDAGPSATRATTTTAEGQAAPADPRDAPVPMVNGKPLWAANRKHTAEENADYQFGKNGKDFGALTEADYVAKAHAFVDSPPAGVQKIERSNGDDLLYDAQSNTFAVVTKAGAPRTMFKPRAGANYWKEQQTRAADEARGESSQG
ncbi:MAG TPA: hypothetical protein VMU93_10780 [Caulobacteraceae bacterium]|nr:hypothetical protein [Caulobacteraceae bacterium]